jgi:hypothetical protein
MKTLVLSLSMFVCLAGIPVNAQAVYVTENKPVIAAEAKASTIHSAIFDKIQQSMRVPAGMKSAVSSERVRVVFTIDKNGKAHVVDVCTRRPELKDSVTTQFEAIDFSDSGNTNGQEFSIWLNFKVM